MSEHADDVDDMALMALQSLLNSPIGTPIGIELSDMVKRYNNDSNNKQNKTDSNNKQNKSSNNKKKKGKKKTLQNEMSSSVYSTPKPRWEDNISKIIYVSKRHEEHLRRARSSIGSRRDIRLNPYWSESEYIIAGYGVIYIPVHIEGSDEDIKKAIAIIEKHVGQRDVYETIFVQPKKMESIYIKADTRRTLISSRGTIKSKSFVESIDVEYERLKASNGDTYVLVHVTGCEEAIQNAIGLIEENVGRDNYEVDIDLYDEDAAIVLQSIYVRSSAKRNLENSRRLNEIANRSGLKDILIEGESGNSKIPKEVKTANGINYIVVRLKGDEDAIQKAIALIKEAVGINNVKDEIDLPPNPDSLMLPAPPVEEKNPAEEASPKKTSPSMLRLIAVIMYKTLIRGIRILWGVVGSVVALAYGYIIWTLRLPLKFYQANGIEKTIYVKSSQSNILTGKQGRRKKKGIINKSGVEDIQINTLSDSDDYLSVHVVGSRQTVQKAIALIQGAVGVENVEEEYVSTNNQPSRSPPTQTITSSTAAAADISADSEARPNQEDSELEYEVSAQLTLDNLSSDTPEAQEQNSSMPDTETASQEEQSTMHDDIHILVTEDDNAAADESSTPLKTDPVEDEAVTSTLEQPQTVKDEVQLPQQECVPTEIGINTSTQGMTTGRETITESSMSSFNDGSKASKELSTFTLNENDPLLIFLRSQHTCVRGSVDDFYTWLVKSEFIDSMTALKEAVCDDDYYNDTMKVGCGSSGIKVFKRKVFKRALSEYEESGNKAPATDLNEPPEELVCPISLVLMTNDPVVAADGITYERASIEDWFKKNKSKGSASIYSPVHGTEMESMILIPNIGTRNMARAFKDKK